jgi:leucyl/phenylalanyl-tRNA--protein transferase
LPAFPPIEQAFSEPNGLLCAGGALDSDWLEAAYRVGVFPWFNEGDPILWWSPDPRAVFMLSSCKVPKRLYREGRSRRLRIALNDDFERVIRLCGTRPGIRNPSGSISHRPSGTWITESMIEGFVAFHQRGRAHALAVYEEERLLGAVYGVAIGSAFFGESMVSLERNGSKFALFALMGVLRTFGFELLDAQVESAHVMSLGAQLIARSRFSTLLQQCLGRDCRLPRRLSMDWQEALGVQPASAKI